MKILVTGSKGFVGKNLVENLKNIMDGKDRTRPGIHIKEIYETDIGTDPDLLDRYCKDCDFVFNLAGVNRPRDRSEFMKGNFGFASALLDTLKKYENTCPVMLSSSIQAASVGRYKESDYGKSKQAGEELFFQYSAETGSRVLVYRFPNLFGKWARPNYNSVIATFCNAIANDLEYTVNDSQAELELLYIDDLVRGMLDALEGKEVHCEYEGLKAVEREDGRYCYIPLTYHVTLGEIVEMLGRFKAVPSTQCLPEIPGDSFAKKLYSTYLSYLPEAEISYGFKSNTDTRGAFTELFRTASCGQVSVNLAKPGVTKGQHWHNSKWEIFVVVSGHGLIRERKVGIDPETGKAYPAVSFEVRGNELRAVQILPGYTHSITNLSETKDLITVMWANEMFDPEHPDTFYEEV